MLKRVLVVGLITLTVALGGCSSGEKKSSDSSGSAATAAKMPCTKCACANWTDGNGDGKCDTMVSGKACDHAKADHKAP
jgi:hypothetical protein